jgi:hypothetical protein
VATNATTPFTINLQVSSGASLVGGSSTVVLYRVTKGADLTKFFTGVLSGPSVTVSGTTVSVTTTWFGAYQVVTTTADLSAVKDTSTTQPIVVAAEIRSALTGTWKRGESPIRNLCCRSNSHGTDWSDAGQYHYQSLPCHAKEYRRR